MFVRRAAVAVVLVVLCVLAAGCGKKNPSSPSNTNGSGDQTAFNALVQTTYPSGAVLPTTLESDASLLALLDIGGVTASGALFRSDTSFVNAGLVRARSSSYVGIGSPTDTLAELSAAVGAKRWYVYSSIPNLPSPPPILFDGTSTNTFTVAGAGTIPAFSQSILSVSLPVVTAPGASENVYRNAPLSVTWSDAGADTSAYVLCVLRANSDTTRIAVSDLVRDTAGGATIPVVRLQLMGSGAGRLAVARYRIARMSSGVLRTNLVCEATTLRNVVLQ